MKVYKNQIPPETGRKYRIAGNPDGTSQIDDVTEYIEEGTPWAAGDANEVAEHMEDGTIHVNKNTLVRKYTSSSTTIEKLQNTNIKENFEADIGGTQASGIGLSNNWWHVKVYAHVGDGYTLQEARPLTQSSGVATVLQRHSISNTWGPWIETGQKTSWVSRSVTQTAGTWDITVNVDNFTFVEGCTIAVNVPELNMTGIGNNAWVVAVFSGGTSFGKYRLIQGESISANVIRGSEMRGKQILTVSLSKVLADPLGTVTGTAAIAGSSGPKVTVSATAPSSPRSGDLWIW